ncbi:MAG TPA: hypothetical protein DCZ69_01450 [Syntrophobacteraceae bacterium]|nr:hypothetical protein [Syntrophobacteraceae bacterium]HBD06901.1 hypothetical protein [Syntrophobacteraceae bacterium]HBZ56756.1 hypothetical protein [Syntrophobacteraceae bacterium]
MFLAQEVFDLAIRLERNGESCYRHLAGLITEDKTKSVLQWLADQEAQHAVFFTHLKANCTDKGQAKPTEAPSGLNLADFIGDRALSLEEVDVLALTDPSRIFQVALGFERDTILFFDMLRAFIDDDHAAAQLEAVVAEERRHIQLLEELIGQATTSL